MPQKFQLGLVGLGVMGRNLLLNFRDHGVSVLGLDTDIEKARAVDGVTSVAELVAGLAVPRTVLLLVPAGKPVDAAIDSLLPLLTAGDRIIDGGNSHFRDTERREKELRTRGVSFLGMGISGGEEGARTGPSLMPGGDPNAFHSLKPWLEAVAAKVNGQACVDHVGTGAAGHYVKMVHNAIEYGWMQLLSESAYLLHRGAGMSWDEIGQQFGRWNEGELQGFLVEVTANVLRKKDAETGKSMLDVISDVARAKGTGKWASEEARALQIAIPTIDVAVTWRDLSKTKVIRDELAVPARTASSAVKVDEVGEALYFGLVATLAQGLHLLHEASHAYGFGVNASKVVRLWRGGCILRAGMLDGMAQALESNPAHLFLSAPVLKRLEKAESALRNVSRASLDIVASPAFLSVLTYWDAMRDTHLPLSLVQGQRDYFGAHGYERRDRAGTFHTEWKS